MRNYAFNPVVEQSRQVVHSGELGQRRGQPGIDFAPSQRDDDAVQPLLLDWTGFFFAEASGFTSA